MLLWRASHVGVRVQRSYVRTTAWRLTSTATGAACSAGPHRSGRRTILRTVSDVRRHTRFDALINEGVQLLRNAENVHAGGEADHLAQWARQTITAAAAQGRTDIVEMLQALIDHLADVHAAVIDRATAIIIERFRFDAERAAGLLAKLSQSTGAPIYVTAQRLINHQRITACADPSRPDTPPGRSTATG
jgi:hypothetical protein